MMKTFNCEKGFTMLELMVAMSVFSILILAVYATFFSQYSRFTRQMNLATMIVDSNRSIAAIEEVVEDYGNLTVSGGDLLSDGTIIIDCDGDDFLEGSELSLHHTKQQLIDGDDNALGDHITGITFVLGPTVYQEVGVDDGMLLYEVSLEINDMSYSVKGGINVER